MFKLDILIALYDQNFNNSKNELLSLFTLSGLSMAVHLNRVTFANGSIEVVAHLRLFDGMDRRGPCPAIVVVGPGSSVKEQAGGIYAEKLSALGYVTLVFDPSCQGESSGEPRDLEDPALRVEDIRCAVDFLMTLPYVDENAIGILGICAGGGYAVNAATTDHRIRAVGMVVGNDLGAAFRRIQPQAAAVSSMLAIAATQRTAEARGNDSERIPWIPESLEAAKAAGIDDPAVLEAIDFYGTPRGQHPNRTNLLLARSIALILGFDAFNLAGELLTQPTQIIVGGKLGTTFSHETGRALWERLRNRKDFVVIEGASHYDLYDKAEFVDQAIECLEALYAEELQSANR